MSDAELEAKLLEGVREVLRTRLGLSRSVELETHLTRDLQLDSLQQLALVVELENRFQVCFAPGDEQGITTVADVVALLRKLHAGGTAP